MRPGGGRDAARGPPTRRCPRGRRPAGRSLRTPAGRATPTGRSRPARSRRLPETSSTAGTRHVVVRAMSTSVDAVCLCLLIVDPVRERCQSTVHSSARGARSPTCPGSTVPACAGTGCSPSSRRRPTSWPSATATPRSPTAPGPSSAASAGPTGSARPEGEPVRVRVLGGDVVSGRVGARRRRLAAGRGTQAHDVLVPAHAVVGVEGPGDRRPRRPPTVRCRAPWRRRGGCSRATARSCGWSGPTAARCGASRSGSAPTSWSSAPAAEGGPASVLVPYRAVTAAYAPRGDEE